MYGITSFFVDNYVDNPIITIWITFTINVDNLNSI